MITSDRFGGPEYIQRAIFEDAGDGGPSSASQLVYSSSNFLAQDSLGVFNLRRPWMNHVDGPSSDVAGTTYYKTVTYITGVSVPSVVSWFSDGAKSKLVATDTYTYSPTVKVLPVTVIYRKYGPDGVTVTATATDTYTYNGVFESSRIRAYS